MEKITKKKSEGKGYVGKHTIQTSKQFIYSTEIKIESREQYAPEPAQDKVTNTHLQMDGQVETQCLLQCIG